ncbi:MAG: hypothetical protein ABIA93_00310 [Candidatus Woesearchaeota archaeon]
MKLKDKLRMGVMVLAIPAALMGGFRAGTVRQAAQEQARHSDDSITMTVKATEEIGTMGSVDLEARIGGQVIRLNNVETYVIQDSNYSLRIGSSTEGYTILSTRGADDNNPSKKRWVEDRAKEFANEHSQWGGTVHLDDGYYGDAGCAGGRIGPATTRITYSPK